ncbi:MAG: dTDP-4-dehydrorhamnose 3,5-epimerase [Oscillospiraceae bacterium]|nr:dTDP-4-dehydrorhamnose 3,5-epimerase [Oscillospiraceae bacterium]
MKIEKTFIGDLKIIHPTVFEDERGWFYEAFSAKHLPNLTFVQDNHSKSLKAGTLRGLHFQTEPFAQTKLVRCTKGSLLDVAVDLRQDSPTYKKWFSLELSAENKKQLLIPKGFAHGFVTLESNTEIQYKTDNFYSREHDRSIRYDDPEIGIEWGLTEEPVLSDKDSNAPFLKEDCAEK